MRKKALQRWTNAGNSAAAHGEGMSLRGGETLDRFVPILASWEILCEVNGLCCSRYQKGPQMRPLLATRYC